MHLSPPSLIWIFFVFIVYIPLYATVQKFSRRVMVDQTLPLFLRPTIQPVKSDAIECFLKDPQSNTVIKFWCINLERNFEYAARYNEELNSFSTTKIVLLSSLKVK
jgi:hypothetical protein